MVRNVVELSVWKCLIDFFIVEMLYRYVPEEYVSEAWQT